MVWRMISSITDAMEDGKPALNGLLKVSGCGGGRCLHDYGAYHHPKHLGLAPCNPDDPNQQFVLDNGMIKLGSKAQCLEYHGQALELSDCSGFGQQMFNFNDLKPDDSMAFIRAREGASCLAVHCFPNDRFEASMQTCSQSAGYEMWKFIPA